MRVLVACEFSGTVRDAFTAMGHDAWSCDVLPTDKPGQHLQGDVVKHLDDGWDLMIGHPPCTYLCNMGIWWNHKKPNRWQLTYKARDFAEVLWNAEIPKICIENPPGYLTNNSALGKPAQCVQPWQHGHEANKPTSLWLKNLPPLMPTNCVAKGKFYVRSNGTRMAAWSHKTSGMNKTKRAKIASTTFSGIAKAMAEQWGGESCR